MNIFILLGGIGLAVVIFLGGYRSGSAVASLEAAQARAGELDKIIVQQKVVEREVPKIVTKVVTKTQTVTKEVDRVVLKSSEVLSPDCVMPHDYTELLLAAARGIDPNVPGSLDAITGEYGCREVLGATLSDLKAGWHNTATLEGLQAAVRVNQPTKGD